jgi:hypothetical protein
MSKSSQAAIPKFGSGSVLGGRKPSRSLLATDLTRYRSPVSLTQESATRNAALHLLFKAQNSRAIQNAVIVKCCPSAVKNVDAAAQRSKVDVYDYAAQFDTLPAFEVVRIPKTNDFQSKLGYYVRITVKGTSIVGEAYHASNAVAEAGAYLNFKERAEEAHQGSRMMVKHINTLTSQTGRKFLEYCKIKQKDWAQYSFVAKQVGECQIQGKLYLGDKLLSECTMFKYVPGTCLMVVKRMQKIYAIIWLREI